MVVCSLPKLNIPALEQKISIRPNSELISSIILVNCFSSVTSQTLEINLLLSDLKLSKFISRRITTYAFLLIKLFAKA